MIKLNQPLAVNKNANQNVETQKSQFEGKMKKAAKMYERMFLQEMVKAMRSTVSYSEGSKPGMAEKIYMDKTYDKYVDRWSDSGGVGIADNIYQQLVEKFSPYHRPRFNKPQGPLPVSKDPLPVSKEPRFQKIDRLKADEAGYLMKPGENGEKSVTSPWSGKLMGVTHGEEGRKLLQIDHGLGIKSQLGFTGQLQDLSVGDELAAGQKIAELQQGFLMWKVKHA